MHPTSSHLLAFLLSVPAIQAHYIFNQIVLNGANVGQEYTYTRKNTNSYQPSYTSEVINSKDAICNKGANTLSSQTLAVKAGDKVGFKLAYNEKIEHPGPGFIYLSKAPGDIDSYTGDGDWFKVWESGVNGPANEDTNWGTWQQPSMEFTIPAGLPDGDYLARPEHIAIHEAHVGKAQFYMECTQLSVSGGGSGSPSPMVKIPGLYSADDPGIAYNIWTDSPAEYVMPGPAVWSGGGSSSSAQASTGGSTSGSGSSGSGAASGSSASTGGSSSSVVAGSGAAPSSSAIAGSGAAPSSSAVAGSGSTGAATGSTGTGSTGSSTGSSDSTGNTGSGSTGGSSSQAAANSASTPAAGSAATQGGWAGAWGSRIKGRRALN